MATFEDLGVCKELLISCKEIGWESPTKVQLETVPLGIKKRDMIVLSATGSGKTGAFVIPIIQNLLENPARMRALIITPTRELSVQIYEQFTALGSNVSLIVTTLIGGMDVVTQALSLAKKPHVIVGTPGRITDHLQHTKGFSLKNIKYLVLDEADRLLSSEFDEGLEKILEVLPHERQTMLFSATMTSNISKLQKAALQNPKFVSVDAKNDTAEGLVEHFKLIPFIYKHAMLIAIIKHFGSAQIMVFANMCDTVLELGVFLKHLGHDSITLSGRMSQPERLTAINSFKRSTKKLLVATDVASRGLDIPAVDVVICFDVPLKKNDYIHRVGRTARAGRHGRSIILVTQYDVESFAKIECFLKRKLDMLEEIAEPAYMKMQDDALEAYTTAVHEIKELYKSNSTRKFQKKMSKKKSRRF